MPTAKERNLILWAGAGLILILVLVLLMLSAAQRQIRPADIDSYGPEGLKALALLLEAAGCQPLVSGTELTDPPMLLILNSTTNLSKPIKKTFLNWVENGGTLIELAQDQPQLNPQGYRLGVVANPQAAVPSTDPRLNGLVYYPRHQYLAVAKDPQFSLYTIGDQAFIYSQHFGRGRIITWTDPGGLSNRYLKEHPDNAVIFVLLVKSYRPVGPAEFYYPKFETGTSLGHSPDYRTLIYRYWIALTFALAGIALVLWKVMSRFGRPRPLVLAAGRSYNEFLLSLAGLFQLANSRSLVLDNLWRDLRQTMAQITGLSPETEIELLMERLTVFTGKSFPELSVLAAELNQPQLELYSKENFLRLAHKIDGYRKELSQWRGSRNSKRF